MGRSPLFDHVRRAMRIARFSSRQGISVREALARVAEAEARDAARCASRREFLTEMTGLAAAGALASVVGPARRAFAAPASGVSDVGIVGAGLAGLSCADALLGKGVLATIYEGRDHVGGRCWTGRSSDFPGFFRQVSGQPSQVFERGGELIDTGHKTMLGYAQRFDLARELQWDTFGGTETYWFLDPVTGAHRLFTEEEVIAGYRVFFDTMQTDLRLLSGCTTADAFTEFDAVLDRTTLLDYFDGRRPGGGEAMPSPAREVFGAAYMAEYGLELDRQSSLNFLYFAKASRRAKFIPFGNFSDERYHLVNGNDGVASGLAGDFQAAGGTIRLEHRLIQASKRSDGRVELTFRTPGGTVTRAHEAVVIAIPFSVLRDVDLDGSLGLPGWKLTAISELGYGTNAKTMIHFDGRYWATCGTPGNCGGVGISYSDLPNHQNTWETNPSRAISSGAGARAILTDYASGERGARLSTTKLQVNVDRFLTDLDQVWPGARAAATRSGGAYVAHLQHWPSDPFAKGSYTCYTPGQFTRIAGNEAKSVGNVFFAGEHTNSFYDWQGFMEGACLSGIEAANQVLGAKAQAAC